MISYRPKIRTVLLAGTALLAAGCASQPGEYTLTSEVSPEEALLQFRGGPLTGATPRRVVHTNPWEYVEYASGMAGGLRFEMAYVSHVGTNTTVEYPHTLRKMIGSWRHNAGQLAFGTAQQSPSPVEDMWYLPYRVSASNEACAGFQAEWDSPMLDPMRRPGRVLFGYLCAAPGSALTVSTIEGVLANISIRGITERIRNQDPQQVALGFGDKSQVPAQERSEALAVARQGADGSGGNPAFPFGYVVTFTTNEGGEGAFN